MPILGKLFSGENVQRDKTELVIALIPHIVRGPDITSSNLRGIGVGNATQIKVNYGARRMAPVMAPPATAPAVSAPPATAPLTAPVTAPGMPPVTAPPENASPAPQAGGVARVSFLPGSSVDTQLGQTVTVTLYADNVRELTQAAARLQFDPRILHITNIVAADLPQRDGSQVLPAKNILNDTGVAEVSFARPPGSPGVSGAGGLFSVVLQAIARGNTSVTLSSITMGGSTGPIATGAPPPLVVNVQ